MTYRDGAQLALAAIHGEPTGGIPSWTLFLMEHGHIERLAGAPPGAYQKDPEATYLAMQRAVGTCLVDQWIPQNPMTMGASGYEADASARNTPTTGARKIVCDGHLIDSPEAVVEHMEQVAFPQLQNAIAGFDMESRVQEIVDREQSVQALLGDGILKTGHGIVRFPTLWYSRYGYVHYLSAYALYPEVVERQFALEADLSALHNQALAWACARAKLPRLHRLDHDMADSRGLLVRPETLDKIWLSHFARSLEPVLRVGVRLIWHCDGNLTDLLPRLLAVGIHGFQGFQYEDGMDYARICQMRTREGERVMIMAGVSVTRTLPFGTPDDVKRELRWLVEYAPPTGLFLGASSSITPGVPWENVQTLVEGLAHYRVSRAARG